MHEVFIYKNHLIRFYNIQNVIHYEILNMMDGDLVQKTLSTFIEHEIIIKDCFMQMVDYEQRTIK